MKLPNGGYIGVRGRRQSRQRGRKAVGALVYSSIIGIASSTGSGLRSLVGETVTKSPAPKLDHRNAPGSDRQQTAIQLNRTTRTTYSYYTVVVRVYCSVHKSSWLHRYTGLLPSSQVYPSKYVSGKITKLIV